jgi:hypothetical protein
MPTDTERLKFMVLNGMQISIMKGWYRCGTQDRVYSEWHPDYELAIDEAMKKKEQEKNENNR